MKTLISGLFIYPRLVGGAENYVYNLLKGWKQNGKNNEFEILLQNRFKDQFDSVVRDFSPKYTDLKRNRIFHELTGWYPGFEGKFDKIFFPNYTAPLKGSKKVNIFSTIHDLQYIYYPDFFRAVKRASLRFNHLNALKKSKKVIAISNHVKKSIVDNYGSKWEDKVEVIHNPVDFKRFANPRYDGFDTTTTDYILTVANQWPHKNILSLIKAYKEVYPNGSRDYKLVLTGQLGDKVKGGKYEKYAAELDQEIRKDPDIFVTGYVSDQELGKLYQNADLFVLPSLFEGFGMPAIEAMGHGIPTILTNRTSLPEISLGKAKYVQEPMRIEEWTEIIKKTLENIEEEKTKAKAIEEQFQREYEPGPISMKYYQLFS